MSKIWTTIRHNYSLIIGCMLALCVLYWAYGCHSTVVSVITPPRMVTREELKIEVDTFLAQAKLKFEDLDRQDKLKSTLFNTAIEFVTEGKINPVAVALSLGNVLGIGAIIDNRRKDVRIKSAKSEIESLSKARTTTEA